MILPDIKIPDRMPRGFLGNVIQVCIVTADYKRTVQGMLRAGIGPWTTYTFDSTSCTQLRYYDQPADFAMKLCFATTGSMIWEIIQPLKGPCVQQDFLDQHGEGIHHVAFDCNNVSWEEKVAGFEKGGFKLIQSGRWLDLTPWGYFSTEDATSTTFEVWSNPPGWQRPPPEEIFE
ncbi:MAG: VOC family protein [Rhizobiaceae bacterium]|nr:VOC family protein [Rhizobiaceae bacterium]